MHGITILAILVCGTALPSQNQVSQKPNLLQSRKQARTDLKKLQGAWIRVAMEEKGKTVSVKGQDLLAIYQGDLLTLKRNGKVYRHSIITLDPSQTPKATNDWDLDGPFKNKVVPGIYELKGDTLKVCFAPPGNERPTSFTTKSGTGFLYIVYERQKRSGKKPGSVRNSGESRRRGPNPIAFLTPLIWDWNHHPTTLPRQSASSLSRRPE